MVASIHGPATTLEQHTTFPAAARLRFELMDEPVRPARGKAGNKRRPPLAGATIGSPRADSIMARSTKSSTTRPKIRLQSNAIATSQDPDRTARDEEDTHSRVVGGVQIRR